MDKLRVLILEDDQDVIDLVATALGDRYECYAAPNGLEGMQLAQKGEPDLFICDVMMPVMDGHEFARRIKKFAGFDRTPIIYLSALSSREQIRDGYETGAVLYLTKPIDPVRFKRNIDLYVDDHAIVARPKARAIGELLFNATEAPPTPRRESVARPLQAPQGHAQPSPAQQKSPAPLRPATPAPTTSRPVAAPAGTGGVVRAAPRAPLAPAVAAARSSVILKRAGADQTARRVRILAVDDDQDTLRLISVGLKNNFETVEAGDGVSAVEAAVRYKPDVFIIDGNLPRMNGFQLMTMLRQNPEFFRTPIIFISGRAAPEDQESAKKMGASCFLAKPFSAKRLMEALEQIVSDPGFAIKSGRIGIEQAHLEQLQHHETHRAQPMTDLDQMERRRLESLLREQLK